MFYLAKCELRTNLCRITISQKTTNLSFSFCKNENSKLSTTSFSKFWNEKTQSEFLTRGDFINGQTHKKTSRHQGNLRSLGLLSSEPLHNQNEKQTQQAKLLGISPKTLTLTKSIQWKLLTSYMQVWAVDKNF